MLLASAVVSVTVFAPTLVQVKLVMSSVVLLIAQLSEEPLSMSPAVMVAFPLASRKTLMLWQTAVGAVESTTVTVEVQEELLLLASARFRVTVLEPISEQLKLLLLSVLLLTEQLSLEPPSMSLTVMEALPEASRKTLILLQTAAGAVESSTMIVVVQEAVLLLGSVTVSVTLFEPISVQAKLVCETEVLLMEQLSAEPPSTSAPEMVALPDPSR